jgi:IstB-like ATP binding protein
VSLVQRLANLSPRCKAGNGAALAPPGLAHVLAPAFTPHHRAARPPPNCGGTSDPYPPNDHGKSTLGSAEDPGGAGAPWVQCFGENSRQVYATNRSSRPILPLAATIITTSLQLDEWYELFGKKNLVDALLDRLRHRCISINIDGPSLRTPEAQAASPGHKRPARPVRQQSRRGAAEGARVGGQP